VHGTRACKAVHEAAVATRSRRDTRRTTSEMTRIQTDCCRRSLRAAMPDAARRWSGNMADDRCPVLSDPVALRHQVARPSSAVPTSTKSKLWQSLARRSGTVSRILSGIRQLALTLSDVCWRHICLHDTIACSALEVHNFIHYINLLTYLHRFQ